jgi:hypothetical protein
MKYTKYILILVVLAGLLSPVGSVSAQTDPTYTLLAPLKCANGSPNCDSSGEFGTFDPTPDDALGKYLNIMINLVIGISAVLAVVMIVIGGVEYMTSELISGKEAGRERITNAILGLLIALGAYVLLATINPKLLDTNITITPATFSLVVERELPGDAILRDTGPLPTGAIPNCPSGIQVTRSGMYACGSMVQNINNMIDAARAAGHVISGGGYRSHAEQIRLRIQNCSGDTTSRNPNPPCNPPTALPGNSRHNQGLAFDLKCNGTQITSRNNPCFIWLSANASTYGLLNFQREPWHWSVDGR